MALAPGTRLGPYTVLAPLGAGGMGEVYRARDGRLERDVAVKVLPPSFATDPDGIERLLREARAVAALNHPGILSVFDVGEANGTSFLVFELLEGETLRLALRGARWPLGRIVELGLQLLRALSVAHEKGVVHRDLKPENLFLTRDDRLKILDFGLAKRRDTEPTVAFDATAPTLDGRPTTQAGTVLGTPGYMAPEQARGLSADARSDLFACGAILFEMATGERAFGAGGPATALADLFETDPLERAGHLPPALEALLRRSLRRDPAARFGNAVDMIAALEALQTSPPQSAPPEPTIAVLPFANLSADPEHEYFCDGIAEEILNALSRVGGLRVASRTSSRRYRTTDLDARAIGERLSVANILEGSVRRSGERVRIAVQLVSAADGYQRWAERFDRRMADIFELQDEIARTVVDALEVRLASPAAPLVRRTTDDPEAYELYLRGRFHWYRRSSADLAQARRCFERAVALDPRFAEGYFGLGQCFVASGAYSQISGREAKAGAASNAARALELAPRLAEAWSLRATHDDLFACNAAAAEAGYLRALELDGLNPLAHAWYGILLAALGREPESRRELRRAVECDPTVAIVRSYVGWALYFCGAADESVRHFQDAIDLDPTFWQPHLLRGWALTDLGRHEQALADFERAAALDDSPMIACGRVRALALAPGGEAEARRALESLAETARRRHVSPYDLAAAHLALGDRDEAFRELERALEDCSPWRRFLAVDPRFDALRTDTRFPTYLERLGLREIRRHGADPTPAPDR